MNRKETICSGIKNGKRCPNLISNEAVFCLDCGSTNTDNVSAQSFCEWDNKNTEESDTSESQDDDNGNEKWDFSELLNTSHAIDVSTNSSSKRCNNCGHTIQQDRMFCDKCGNKVGAVCIGEINGKPCSKFISVETKFCSHCGTANIENSSGNKKAPLKRSCKSCGHDVHKHQKFCHNCGYKIGAHCLGIMKGNPCNEFLNIEIKFCANCGNHNPDYITVSAPCKDQKSLIPSNESDMELTGKIAIDSQKLADDEEKEAKSTPLNLFIHDETMVQKKPIVFEEEIKDSDEERPACGEISTSNVSSVGGTTTDDSHDGSPSDIDVPSAENTTDDSGDGYPPELKVPSADTVVSLFTEVDEKTLFEEIKTDIASFKFDLKMKYGGLMSLAQTLSKYTESSKKVKVNVAVAGESGTGKSSFTNAIRGVKHGDPSYSEVGFGNTTMEIKKYQHPKNKRIQLYDLPGYNTTKMTLQNLLKVLNLSDFDCCLLFFYPVPSPADKTFVQQLQTAGTKFCFVRTKLDEDFENGELDGTSKEEVLSEIKKKVDMSSNHFEELKNAATFYISSDEPSVGEMNELISFIENQINPRKFEAFLLSLPSFTEEVIQKKYQSLKNSAVFLAVKFAVFYPLFFKIEENIKAEIEMYFQTFELNTTLEKNVKDLKHRFSEGICHLLEEFDNGVSGMRSPIKRYVFCKTFLQNLIKELSGDAKTMYKHMLNEQRK